MARARQARNCCVVLLYHVVIHTSLQRLPRPARDSGHGTKGHCNCEPTNGSRLAQRARTSATSQSRERGFVPRIAARGRNGYAHHRAESVAMSPHRGKGAKWLCKEGAEGLCPCGGMLRAGRKETARGREEDDKRMARGWQPGNWVLALGTCKTCETKNYPKGHSTIRVQGLWGIRNLIMTFVN